MVLTSTIRWVFPNDCLSSQKSQWLTRFQISTIQTAIHKKISIWTTSSHHNTYKCKYAFKKRKSSTSHFRIWNWNPCRGFRSVIEKHLFVYQLCMSKFYFLYQFALLNVCKYVRYHNVCMETCAFAYARSWPIKHIELQ